MQLFSVLYCTDTPDLTSTSGYESYIWNNEITPNSVITYRCPPGQAFEGIWRNPMDSKCAQYGKNKDNNVYRWRFNEDIDLPDCVRKYY